MAANRQPTYADPALIDQLESRIGALEAALQPNDGGSDRTQQYRQGQAVLGGLPWGSGQDTVAHQGSEFVRNGPKDPNSDLDARLQELQDQIDILTLLASNGSKDLNQSSAGQVSQRKGDDGNTGADTSLPPPGDVGTVLTSNGFLVDPSYQSPPSTALTWLQSGASSNSTSAAPTSFVVTYPSVTGSISSALSAGTGVFTAPAAGVYTFLICGNTTINSSGSSTNQCALFLQQFIASVWTNVGVSSVTTVPTVVFNTALALSTTLSLAAGDQVRVSYSAQGAVGGPTYQVFVTMCAIRLA